MNWNRYPYAKDAALTRMEQYGGGFTRALALAWRRADTINACKLANEFNDYLMAYAHDAWRTMDQEAYVWMDAHRSFVKQFDDYLTAKYQKGTDAKDALPNEEKGR